MKRVLCVYATRQIDSNLFMSSTVFNGLQQCGYHVDMVFLGYKHVCDVFAERYAKYFNTVYYFNIKESWLSKQYIRTEKIKLLYSFYLHFVKDYFVRPYCIKNIKKVIHGEYDVILSFIPPALSGYLAWSIKKEKKYSNVPLIQFWTDPLSLGRCNDITEIPRTRFMHVRIERQLLSYADKVVFCYPLLCEMEQRLHPDYKDKMSWSDVGYTEHTLGSEISREGKTKIGLFGSYHSKVRNIFPLLEVIKTFPNVQFVIRGDSDIHIDVNEFNNLDLVEGRRPVGEIEELEAECDILLCLGGKSGITHPAGKVFYYANYSKPIVYIGDGVHNSYFKHYLTGFNRYIICDNNPRSIECALGHALLEAKNYQVNIPQRLEPKNVAMSIVG